MNSTLNYWVSWQRAEGLGERVIRERVQNIEKMLRETNTDLTTVGRADLVTWLGMHPWAPSTRSQRRSLLHTFFTWMQDEGVRADNPAARLPRVRVPKHAPDPFSITEIQTLLNSGVYRKTRAAIALHYYLGLRVSEIAAVHGRDVDFEGMVVRVVGKGSKRAALPFPDAVHALVREMPSDAYWFPNRQRNALYEAGEGHVLGKSISESINDAIKRAGLSHRGHQLRAATATEMNRAGVDSFTIRDGMRHESMATTQVYTKVDLEAIRAGLNRLPVVDLAGERRKRRPADAGSRLAA